MITKPRKLFTEVASVDLLSILSMIFEKLLKKIKNIVYTDDLIISFPFGYRKKNFIVQQLHTIVYDIKKTLEEKKMIKT